MTKQDEIMYKIIREIVSDKRKKGDTVCRKDYELNANQMTGIFKILSERDIIEKAANSLYYITGRSTKNAKELCLSEISKRLNDVFKIAESGNIDKELLIDFIKMLINDNAKRTDI